MGIFNRNLSYLRQQQNQPVNGQQNQQNGNGWTLFPNRYKDRILKEEQPEHKQASFGDVIGVNRIGYRHFGIYADDEHIIHYAQNQRGGKEAACVIETDLNYFLNGARSYFVCRFPEDYGKPEHINIPVDAKDPVAVNAWNNLLWLFKKNSYKVFSPEETVERARGRLGECRYDLVVNNCEHFAIWCKTGIAESHQVNQILHILPIEMIPV